MIIAIIILAFAACFCLVVFFGAPYLSKQQAAALDLLELKPGQTLLELGSGDGRVAKLAAKKGIKVVGFELNPLLAVFSYFYTIKYRKNVKIIWGNFWLKDWPDADGIFVFLLDKYMPKLDQKLKKTKRKPLKVASFAFKIPGKKLLKQKDGVFLYQY